MRTLVEAIRVPAMIGKQALYYGTVIELFDYKRIENLTHVCVILERRIQIDEN